MLFLLSECWLVTDVWLITNYTFLIINNYFILIFLYIDCWIVLMVKYFFHQCTFVGNNPKLWHASKLCSECSDTIFLQSFNNNDPWSILDKANNWTPHNSLANILVASISILGFYEVILNIFTIDVRHSMFIDY